MLLDAQPNPVAGAGTTVHFALPAEAAVVVSVHDVQGRLVRVLGSGMMAAGGHDLSWDRLDDHGRRAAAGVYWIRLEAAGLHLERQVVVLR